ncbi:hypothetical protein BH09ACT2_BH09ACT2_11530 [soil metagenome]
MSVMEDLRKSREPIAPEVSGDVSAPVVASRVIAEQLREISALSTRFQKHVGHSLSINDTDLSAMEHLMTSGPLTPTDLSHRLGISTAATTVMVDRLTALGHVHREPHAHDRRKVVVVPTPASVQEAFATLEPMIAGVTRVTSALPAEESAVVTRFLSEVIGVFRGAIPAGD